MNLCAVNTDETITLGSMENLRGKKKKTQSKTALGHFYHEKHYANNIKWTEMLYTSKIKLGLLSL